MTARQAWNRTDEQEAYEERAAITEYDGGLTRQEAERKAAVNRERMPVIAGVVDAFRKAFGPVRVTHATENGLELGRNSTSIHPDGASINANSQTIWTLRSSAL